MPFISAGDGDLKSAFITDSWLIDQFVGNRLWTWGQNTLGKLGDNTTVNKSSPIQTITGGVNWKNVIFGNSSSHGVALKTDGTLWTWGYNISGQLGDNTIIHRSSPVQTVSFGSDWMSIGCGDEHSAGIKTDGTLWLWGRNFNPTYTGGQLGDNTTIHKSSPIQTISGGFNWTQVSCGWMHTGAIKTDGTLWMWGYGTFGQLGNNGGSVSSPVQTVSTTTNWKQVSCGRTHTAAIKTDGTLWTWGYNIYGQLGDNTTVHKSSPIQTITRENTWKQVACGNNHTVAIKIDGTLWGWGQNDWSQLGENYTLYSYSSPVQTAAYGNNWSFVACGYKATVATKTDGSLWCWGYNYYGQAGNGAISYRVLSPQQTSAFGTNWKRCTSGYNFTAAVTYGD